MHTDPMFLTVGEVAGRWRATPGEVTGSGLRGVEVCGRVLFRAADVLAFEEKAAGGAPPARRVGPESCLDEVTGLLSGSPSEWWTTMRVVVELRSGGTGYRPQTVRDALRVLVGSGRAVETVGARNAYLFRWSGAS